MPDPHVLFPDDGHGFEPAIGQKLARGLDRRAQSASARSRTASCFAACATASKGAISLTVAPGGFSSMTCLRASSASRACALRTCGGVQSVTASISGPSRQQFFEACEMRQVRGRRLGIGDRHQLDIGRSPRSPAHGAWSRSCRSLRWRDEVWSFPALVIVVARGGGIAQRRIDRAGAVPTHTIEDDRGHRLRCRLRIAFRNRVDMRWCQLSTVSRSSGSVGALSRKEARSAAAITASTERMKGLPEALATAICSARSPSVKASESEGARCNGRGGSE